MSPGRREGEKKRIAANGGGKRVLQIRAGTTAPAPEKVGGRTKENSEVGRRMPSGMGPEGGRERCRCPTMQNPS